MKGDTGFILILVVALIVIAIVVAFFFLFGFNTKTKVESSFGDLVGSIGEASCNALGPVRGTLCSGNAY